MRPKNNKYINSFDGSKLVIILSTTDSGGRDTYLPATEDTMTKAKIADQIIMILNSFIEAILIRILLLFDQNH
jgi:hypothetical protein